MKKILIAMGIALFLASFVTVAAPFSADTMINIEMDGNWYDSEC